MELFMKNLLLGVLLLSSFNLMAQTCDFSEVQTRRDKVNQIFDNAMMSGEDHVIALMKLDREEGALALHCIKNDIFEGYSETSLTLALSAAEDELAEELTYLQQMEEDYISQGQYLNAEIARAEKAKVKKEYQALMNTIEQLMRS